MKRGERIEALQERPEFDVVILGGGINGACLYDVLCHKGYRVLLVERQDFASGTSQASGMMVWGGLLYLRNLDFSSVFQLSSDRDGMIRERSSWLAPAMMHYLPSEKGGRAAGWVYSGLWLYWLLGLGRRRAPRRRGQFEEQALIRPGQVKGALSYEEAFLHDSDARFVYRWLASSARRRGQIALNYCTVTGDYAPSESCWRLGLTDALGGGHYPLRAKVMVNCAGVWTDEVNAGFGIRSPFRHVLSKGVYLGLPRADVHQASLFFELGAHDDVITHVPWGPVALWGPTETAVDEIEAGMRANREDVDFLLEHYARRYRQPFERSDIVSVRCGIRPLAVEEGFRGTAYPLDLSRQQKVVRDAVRPWVSCYGGKLTGCTRMAAEAATLIGQMVLPVALEQGDIVQEAPAVDYQAFPGLAEPVVSAAWCAEHELCCTLEDYVRRRTNIAQWVPRGGLGNQDEYAPALKACAVELAQGNEQQAVRLFEDYRETVICYFDPLRKAG